MATLEFDDLRLHRRRHFRPTTTGTSGPRLQASFTLVAVQPHPLGQSAFTYAHFAGDQFRREAFLQMQSNRFEPDLNGMGVNVRTN